jgi:hypothetical protein
VALNCRGQAWGCPCDLEYMKCIISLQWETCSIAALPGTFKIEAYRLFHCAYHVRDVQVGIKVKLGTV